MTLSFRLHGKQVSISPPEPIGKGEGDIWLDDAARGRKNRFTSDPANESATIPVTRRQQGCVQLQPHGAGSVSRRLSTVCMEVVLLKTHF